MKITMQVKQLKDAIEKSSLAALTKESQDEEVKKIRPTDSCIKITATKDSVVFESSSKEVSALHSTNDKDIIIEKEGDCCVEAKSYLKMLKALPKDCSIQLFNELNQDDGNDQLKCAGIIQSNGILTTIAFRNKKEIRRGTNETFPIDGFAPVDYDHKKVLFSINANTFKEVVDQVLFATDPTDLSDLLDRVAIAVHDKKLYLAGTDGKRCAIFSVNDEDAKIICGEQMVLINGELLQKACKSFDDYEIINVIDCEDQEHVILASENTKIRLRVASEEVKLQFPNFLNILKIACPTSIVLNKSDLLEAIRFLSLYNPDKSIFHVRKGKSEIKIEAARRGAMPASTIVECQPIAASLTNPVAMSNEFIIEGCKKIGGKNKACKIQFSFSNDEKKIKMQAIEDTTFVYLMQSMTKE